MSRIYYLAKCMSIWNNIKDNTNIMYNKCYYFLSYITQYFTDNHNKWVFIPGHSLPISKNNICNDVDSLWSYSNNTLTYLQSTNSFTISWLSAKIVIYQDEDPVIEYNIDNFLFSFRIYTTNRPPTLTMLFIVWCIYTKQWFKPSSIIEFHIINDKGEDIILSLQNNNNSLQFSNNKIY